MGQLACSVRQWKKDVKSRYLASIEDKEKLSREMNNRQEELELELERQRLIQKERQQRIEEE